MQPMSIYIAVLCMVSLAIFAVDAETIGEHKTGKFGCNMQMETVHLGAIYINLAAVIRCNKSPHTACAAGALEALESHVAGAPADVVPSALPDC
jgi:hypothetical protein